MPDVTDKANGSSALGKDEGGGLAHSQFRLYSSSNGSEPGRSDMTPTPSLSTSTHQSIYKRLTDIYAEEVRKCQPDSSELLLGWASGFINICVTFPLNKMIFRQQLHGVTVKGAVSQLIGEGGANLYRGVLPPLIQKTGSVAIMFGSFDKIKNSVSEKGILSSSHPISTIACSAALAGWCEAVLMPFERIQTLLQDSTQRRHFKNTTDAFMRLSEYGYREYYRGMTIVLLRNSLSNIFFFSMRTPISLSTQELGAPKALSDFCSGALLGATISTIMYPLNTLKTHMQKHLGGSFLGVRRTFSLVLNERGGKYGGLFRGVQLNCTRAFISWGIINMSYEYLKNALGLSNC